MSLDPESGVNTLVTFNYIKNKLKASPTEKLVLYTLLGFRNSMTGRCNPEVSTIANDAGYKHHRPVEKALKSLRDRDIIRSVRTMKTSHYYFVFEWNALLELYHDDDSAMNKSYENEFFEKLL